MAGGASIGWAGPLEGDAPKWSAPLFGFEVSLDVASAGSQPYQPIPTTPAVVLDVALVLPGGVSAIAVELVIRREAGPLLERLEVFDEYRGAGMPAGARSVAWHCGFRAPDRTLRDSEVQPLLEKALRALEGELDVRRRAG